MATLFIKCKSYALEKIKKVVKKVGKLKMLKSLINQRLKKLTGLNKQTKNIVQNNNDEIIETYCSNLVKLEEEERRYKSTFKALTLLS